jgi:hypothetical protein
MPWRLDSFTEQVFKKRDMRQCSRSDVPGRRPRAAARARVQLRLDAANLPASAAFSVVSARFAARLRTATKEQRMIVRKVLLAACAAALTASPAWAHPGRAPSDPPRSTGHAHAGPDGAGHHGRSHRCVARKVAYVAAGTLVRQTLVLDGAGGPAPTTARAAADGPARATYSGDVTIDVKRTNRHARADKGTTKTYTLDHARLVLGLDDQNGDGKVDLGDVLPGSRAKVIGDVTKLPKRCDQSGFTPTLTIEKLIVHAPQPQPHA